jgi:fatty acid desaturase
MAKTEQPSSSQSPPDRGGRPTRRPAAFRLALLLVLVALAGIPAVAYLWETVNQLLSFHFDRSRLVLSLPVAVLLVLLLRATGRALTRLDARPTTPPPTGE